jgi:hypothetical protein
VPTLTPTIDGFGALSEIGRGGFGVVYRGRQEALARWEAVKVLPGVSGDSDVFARFTRECQALGSVGNHPNIATVYACGLTDDGSGYLALELLDGGSLAQRSAPEPMPWREVAEVGVALCGALESAHRAGVLHRDIKPENIMFDGLGTPKLLDFGIATVPGAFQSRSSQASLTFAHAAPEVVAGARSTVSSDVYSLASSLFAAVRGGPAFVRDDEDTLIPMLARIAAAPVPDLRGEGVCDDLCSVLERALAKDPATRPASAEELGVELAQVLSAHGGPRLTPPVLVPAIAGPVAALAAPLRVQDATVNGRAPTPAATRGTGRRTWLAAAAVLALLLAGGAGFWLSRAQTGKGSGPLAADSSAGSRPRATTSPTDPAVIGVRTSRTPSTPAAGATGATSPGPDASAPTTASAPSSARSILTSPGTVVQPVTHALVPALPGPGTVSLAAGGAGQVRVLVTWSAGRTGGGQVTGYQVRRTLLSGRGTAGSVVLSTGAMSLTSSVPPAQFGQWYRWSVRSVGPGGQSAWNALTAVVPRVVGERAAVAADQLRAIGLAVVVRHPRAAPKPAQRGLVYWQSVPPGASLQTATTLDCYRTGG